MTNYKTFSKKCKTIDFNIKNNIKKIVEKVVLGIKQGIKQDIAHDVIYTFTDEILNILNKQYWRCFFEYKGNSTRGYLFYTTGYNIGYNITIYYS